MKFILITLFITIFSITTFSQPRLGVPFELKKGETAKINNLKLKYLDGETEWATGWDSQKNRLEIQYIRYHFELESNGKKQEFNEVFNFKADKYVFEILSPQKDITDFSAKSVKLMVKTSEQIENEKLSAKNEIESLAKVKTFALGPTGYAGVISQGEKLMLKILASESAKLNFIWILKNGTDEAKLYALCGLRQLNKKESESYFAEYRTLSTEVQTMSGCEISNEKFSEVVAQIEKMR